MPGKVVEQVVPTKLQAGFASSVEHVFTCSLLHANLYPNCQQLCATVSAPTWLYPDKQTVSPVLACLHGVASIHVFEPGVSEHDPAP